MPKHKKNTSSAEIIACTNYDVLMAGLDSHCHTTS